MYIILIFLTLTLSAMFLYEWANNRRISKEITYIREWLKTAPYLKENRQILLPSENAEMKGLLVELNRSLDEFYAQRISYEHSRQAMTQVLTNISHDLRTPLTVLKGYSELLNREISDMPAKEKIMEMAIKIDSKANELVSTINEYFTLSKITSGDMNMELGMVNVTQICHDIILDYYDVLDERNYKVEIAISPLPEYACADTPTLNRILKNLIDNAIKHGDEGKYLAFRLKRISDKVTIEVEDHGKGISKKDRERIFYRNYTTAHKNFGSGLGLTIAQNLALQMGAEIQVDSEPGQKTVFTLILKS